MATGTDWREGRTEEEAKAKLLSQLTSYVKKNTNQETTSEKIQRGLKDIVETMWGQSDSEGGWEFETVYYGGTEQYNASVGERLMIFSPATVVLPDATENDLIIIRSRLTNTGEVRVTEGGNGVYVVKLQPGETALLEFVGTERNNPGWEVVASDRLPDGCCSSEEFTATQGNSTINVTRNIVGSTIRLEGNVVYNSDDWFAQEFPLINNIIPQDFNDKKWLRATRMFVCHNKNYPAGTRGDNGYIYMNQLSSYEIDSGSDIGSLPNPDTTNFFIPGIDKGSGRSFTVDGFKSDTLYLDNSDPSSPYLKHDYNDPVKDHQDLTVNASNYLFDSPMDLTAQGFSIGYKTSGFVSANEDSNVYTANTNFVDFSFVIEMELI